MMAFNNTTTLVEDTNCKGLQCKAVTQICLTIVSIIIMSVGIYGNGIICLLVYQKSSMRSAINLLLAVLAAADFFTVLYSVSISTLTLLTNDLMDWTLGSKTLCYTHALIHLWLQIVSSTILMVISIDRYIIITQKREFLIRSKVTKSSIILIIVLALFISLMTLIPPMEYMYVPGSMKCVFKNATSTWEYVFVSSIYVLTFAAPFLVICFTCSCVVFAVRKNYARINLFSDTFKRYEVSEQHKYYQPRVDLRFKTRTFYNIAILCFVFVFCRGPYCTYMLVTNFQNSFSPFKHVLLLWLYYLNPALNSMICIWRIRKFRKRFLLYFAHFCYCGDFEIRPSLKIKPSSVLSHDQLNSQNNNI